MSEIRRGNGEGEAGVICGSFGERKLKIATHKNEEARGVERVEKSLALRLRSSIGLGNRFGGGEKEIRAVEMSLALQKLNCHWQSELIGRKLVQLNR